MSGTGTRTNAQRQADHRARHRTEAPTPRSGWNGTEEHVPRRVVETRRTLFVRLDVDAPDVDYKATLPCGDDTPVTVLEQLQADIQALVADALGNALDLGVLDVTVRLGQLHEYKAASEW